MGMRRSALRPLFAVSPPQASATQLAPPENYFRSVIITLEMAAGDEFYSAIPGQLKPSKITSPASTTLKLLPLQVRHIRKWWMTILTSLAFKVRVN
jgi:hypothetical protein